MTSRGAMWLVCAGPVGFASCDGALGPESVASVEIEVDRTVLTEGESLTIGVSALDADGSHISGSEVTWISRDPTTVRVADGGVFAVAPGVTQIVADVRGVRDSVRVRVRFADLEHGEIGVRLQGDRGVRQATGGHTYMRRSLDLEGVPPLRRQTDITTRLGDGPTFTASMPPVLAEPDTVVWITFLGDPEVGHQRLAPFMVDTVNGALTLLGQEGAMVRIVDPSNPFHTELYTPVGTVDLEIDEVVFPDPPGVRGGLLRGAVAFEAAGLILALDTAARTTRIVGPASETTLRIYVEFETEIAKLLYGTAELSINWQGETSTSFARTAAVERNDGTEFQLPVARLIDDQVTDLVVFETRLEASATGRFPVPALDADSFEPQPGGPGTWSFATIYPATQGVLSGNVITGHAYSTGGEIVLTEYAAATSDDYGLIRGTYEIAYSVRDADGDPIGGVLEASVEFVLPVHPMCGLVGPPCN